MMTGQADEQATYANPRFQQIAGSPGGAKAAILNDEVLRRAEARLLDLAPLAVKELAGHIAAIERMSLSAAATTGLFDRAHQVRGIAGTFGFPAVGVVCGALCDYGQEAPAGFAPDRSLLQSLAKLLSSLFAHPDQLPLAEVADYSRRAVASTMAREGRLKSGKDSAGS